jgi:hypothetical protein
MTASSQSTQPTITSSDHYETPPYLQVTSIAELKEKLFLLYKYGTLDPDKVKALQK